MTVDGMTIKRLSLAIWQRTAKCLLCHTQPTRAETLAPPLMAALSGVDGMDRLINWLSLLNFSSHSSQAKPTCAETLAPPLKAALLGVEGMGSSQPAEATSHMVT